MDAVFDLERLLWGGLGDLYRLGGLQDLVLERRVSQPSSAMKLQDLVLERRVSQPSSAMGLQDLVLRNGKLGIYLAMALFVFEFAGAWQCGWTPRPSMSNVVQESEHEHSARLHGCVVDPPSESEGWGFKHRVSVRAGTMVAIGLASKVCCL